MPGRHPEAAAGAEDPVRLLEAAAGVGKEKSMNGITAASTEASRSAKRPASMTARPKRSGARRIIPSAASMPATKARGAASRMDERSAPTPAPMSTTTEAPPSGSPANSRCPSLASDAAQYRSYSGASAENRPATAATWS